MELFVPPKEIVMASAVIAIEPISMKQATVRFEIDAEEMVQFIVSTLSIILLHLAKLSHQILGKTIECCF